MGGEGAAVQDRVKYKLEFGGGDLDFPSQRDYNPGGGLPPSSLPPTPLIPGLL
jgi:hypothetical protein